MADIFISYVREDKERARQLVEILREMGWTVWWDPRVVPGEEFTPILQNELHDAQAVLVLWSHSSVRSEWVQVAASEAAKRGSLVPVLLDFVRPPLPFRQLQSADLSTWKGERYGPEVELLLTALSRRLRRTGVRRAPSEANERLSKSVPKGSSPSWTWGLPRRMWEKVRSVFEGERQPPVLAPPPPPPPYDYELRPREPEPVLLGVSAPRRVQPGDTVSTRFVAYVEALEERVRQQLKDLGGDEAQSALGITPDRGARWRVGTPVTVRLEAGPHIGVRPTEASFEWNGRYNLVSFSLTIAANAPVGRAQLRFEAFIEGLSVAFIPLDIGIAQATDPAQATAWTRPPQTAFASYSSLDAQNVALCLSALSRWDTGLKIFIDCLDLTPNEPWRKELELVIPKQDAFFLFWSANAMKSKWVDWEWHFASASKGIGAIRPFPLDDPAIAPPPAELEHLHFRDRYMMARQALARLAEGRK